MGEGEERRTNPALVRSGCVRKRETARQCAQDFSVIEHVKIPQHVSIALRLFIYKDSFEKDNGFVF